jgi:hypothetical protein
MFSSHTILTVFLSCVFLLNSQNDLDALRYSRLTNGGTPRSIAMGGAFGALGADLSCSSTNPGGLGLYRKGELIFGAGLRFTNNSALLNGQKTTNPGANFIFSNFGLAFSTISERDKNKRNTFAFTNHQLMNYNSSVLINQSGTTNSIAGDMLTIANQSRVLGQFNPTYELMGYNTYVLDYDSASSKFFSFVDLKRNLVQTRAIENSGRMNELNISFAQSNDDKFYIGGSLGIPRLKFESNTTHSETDSNDSMQINLTSATSYTTSYISELPFIYTDKLGFHSLKYREFYKTEGYGINLKLGAVVRLNPNVRVGAYIHSPTIYYLTDTYGYFMEARFDQNTTKPIVDQYPENEGRYEYRIVTPMRFGISGSYIDPKIGAFSLDIENINYAQASLAGETPDVFNGVNAVIRSKYKNATNIRTGFEYNLNPILLRAGYNYYGSPFGGFFSGPFDRQTISFGLGYRSKDNFFYDFAWVRTSTKENYYMFNTNPVKTDLNLISSHLIVSVGVKF